MSISKQLEVYGDFPNQPVYKAFSKKVYADYFIEQGIFRMGSLQSYTGIEDQNRKDTGEGQGHIQVPDHITNVHLNAADPDQIKTSEQSGHRQVITEMGEPIFIFSTSLSKVDVNLLREKFGDFIVQIDSPKQLAMDMTEHLNIRSEKFASGIEGREVSYNRGEVLEGLDIGERIHLSYTQKSDVFSDEKEFRFIAIVMGKHSKRAYSDFIEIDLNGPITYSHFI